jgi:hypothetical protein
MRFLGADERPPWCRTQYGGGLWSVERGAYYNQLLGGPYDAVADYLRSRTRTPP